MKKRILPLIMAGAMMLSSFAGMTMSAHADTRDTAFEYNNLYTQAFSEWRQKDGTTKVYVYQTVGPTIQYLVQGTIGTNLPEFDASKQVTIPTGVKGSITNSVCENRGTKARLKFMSVKDYAGITKGVWSPDSTQNYTVFP